MGVYAPNMTAHFPEQFRMFKYFDMEPSINSGYSIVPPAVTLWGILQNAASEVINSNGNLADKNHENLWTDVKLERGRFAQFDEIIYRIVDGNDWPTEGGFYSYTLQRMIGDNGATDATVWTPGGTLV